MNFLELANREARKRAEDDPHVAIILVGPDDHFALSDSARHEFLVKLFFAAPASQHSR
jgi:hypothetical protein